MAEPQEKHYTYADVRSWPEGERVELIDGAVHMMSPPLRKHQKICGELYRKIADYLEGKKCEVYIAPFGVRLFEKAGDAPYSADTYVEPDITVICDPDKLDDEGCRGAPDLIVEILSPSTVRRDKLVKFNLYQKAGVKEYWIVDPEAELVQVMTLEEGQYYAPTVYTAKDAIPVGVLEDCRVDLAQVFGG